MVSWPEFNVSFFTSHALFRHFRRSGAQAQKLFRLIQLFSASFWLTANCWWFLKARNEGRWKIRAAFDPRSTDIIYLRSGDGRPSIACHLKLDSAFKGCDWSETADYFERNKLANACAMTRGMQAKS